jgi:hypothetical protein
MATRSIVTSQPVLTCDVCGRNLLRGEQPETFVAGMERRTVCELCAPRAAHEGWQREAAVADLLSMPPARRRRGVSLLGRLRQLREPAQRDSGAAHPHGVLDAGAEADLGTEARTLHEPDLSDEALEGLMGDGSHDPGTREAPPLPSGAVAAGSKEPTWHPATATPASEIAQAAEIFNVGEHPRRMAGVARSLGAPSVTIRPVDGAPRRFTIVVSWELCWYRYEVDLDDRDAGARLLEKGMELDELPAQDREMNAGANERGELVFAGLGALG